MTVDSATATSQNGACIHLMHHLANASFNKVVSQLHEVFLSSSNPSYCIFSSSKMTKESKVEERASPSFVLAVSWYSTCLTDQVPSVPYPDIFSA
jgi:hypothetical protein